MPIGKCRWQIEVECGFKSRTASVCSLYQIIKKCICIFFMSLRLCCFAPDLILVNHCAQLWKRKQLPLSFANKHSIAECRFCNLLLVLHAAEIDFGHQLSQLSIGPRRLWCKLSRISDSSFSATPKPWRRRLPFTPKRFTNPGKRQTLVRTLHDNGSTNLRNGMAPAWRRYQNVVAYLSPLRKTTKMLQVQRSG